jgi:hypothetical protein
MTSPNQFLLVKTEKAAKTGLHAKGGITYAIVKDGEEVYVCLLSNDSGGCFGREPVALSDIERCLEGLPADKPILSKTFKPAFRRSRSANSPGFLVAALRHEGLLVAAPDAAHQHCLGANWREWRQAMLASPGEPFELPGGGQAPQATAAITDAEELAGPDSGKSKGRKPRKSPKAERQPPSGTGEEADHASHP